MKKNPDDTLLDNALKSWADKHVATADHLATLQRRVMELPSVPHGVIRVAVIESKAKRPWVYAAIALAASVLVIGGVRLLLTDGNGNGSRLPITGEQHLGGLAWSEVLDRQSRLLAEYQNVFGDRVAWIAETDTRSEVGLEESASWLKPGESRYLLVQVRLLARERGASGWREVRHVNLLVSEEELVQMPAVEDGVGPLTLWVYPMDDELVAVELEGQVDANRKSHIEAGIIQRLGQTVDVGQFSHGGVEYRLTQTVDYVPREGLG